MAGISLTSLQYVASAGSVCCTCNLDGTVWVVDSGASDHMVFDNNLLHNIRSLEVPILMTLPNGNKVKVSQFGDLKIRSNLVLKHALLVPFFRFNLLSVKRLSEQLKCEVVFSENSCVLQGPYLKRPVEIGKSTQGLYILDEEIAKRLVFEEAETDAPECRTACNSFLSNNEAEYSFTCNRGSKSIDLWHRRMGHISFSKLRYVPVLKDFAFNFNKNTCSVPCDICPRAKQQRLPFHTSSISSTKPFDLVHVDTWGPYHTKTHHGHRYFLTLADDYTRSTWTHLMVTKDEAFHLIRSFVAMVKTQFNRVVKVLRSDNALELGLSNEALDFFASTGITHQTSCTQTPQQNGVVERKHKHLLEVSRALLFQSNLPIKF